MPPWEWPTRSTLAAPVAPSTWVTKVASSAADWVMSPVPWSRLPGLPPKLAANTQYPLSARSGDSALKPSAMSSPVPLTRTTGCGWAALGLQDQLFAPGGEADGLASAAAPPARKVQVTGRLAAGRAALVELVARAALAAAVPAGRATVRA